MKILETKTYEYDELSEEAKEEAIEKLWDINMDYDWWDCYGLLDLSIKELKARRIKGSEYSGLLFSYEIESFDFDQNRHIRFKKVVVNSDEVLRKFLRIPKRLWALCEYDFCTPPWSNWNISSTQFEIKDVESKGFTEKQQAVVDRAVEIMDDKIDEALSLLREEYEYLRSKEAIVETIKVNEYMFTEDGKLT